MIAPFQTTSPSTMTPLNRSFAYPKRPRRWGRWLMEARRRGRAVWRCVSRFQMSRPSNALNYCPSADALRIGAKRYQTFEKKTSFFSQNVHLSLILSNRRYKKRQRRLYLNITLFLNCCARLWRIICMYALTSMHSRAPPARSPSICCARSGVCKQTSSSSRSRYSLNLELTLLTSRALSPFRPMWNN